MAKRGPYNRKNISFPSPYGLLFVEEKDPLYVSLVELGYRDEVKSKLLTFLANLGLLHVDDDFYVHLSVPAEARSCTFSDEFPLAVKLISAHDNLLSFRRRLKCRKTKEAEAKSRELKRCKYSASVNSFSNSLFPDIDDHSDHLVHLEEEASLVDSVLLRPSVLFIGMRQPRLLRSVSDILEASRNKSKSRLVDERDEARCSAASHSLGFQVYTLDLKSSDSDFHFCIDVCGITRSKAVSRLVEHRFVEITVDPVWMPEAYLANGLLSPPFFRDALPLFSECLLDNCCVYLPSCRSTFFEICKNWECLSSLFILRFVRKSQIEEVRYCRAASLIHLPDFGKQPLSEYLDMFALPTKMAQDIAATPVLKALLDHHPGDSEAIVFLALSKKAKPVSSRYAPFDPTSFNRLACARASGETTRLVADTVQFLKKDSPFLATPPRSARLQQSANSRLQPQSPYHVTFFGSYGGQQGKQKQMIQPRFNPLSTGVPTEPSPGQWTCLKCGTSTDVGIPLHFCPTCRSTPVRQVSLRSPNLSSSKYCITEDSDDSDHSSESDDELDDGDDDYNTGDHHRIQRQKRISEYGKPLTQADIQLENNELCRSWMGLDDTPSHNTFWRTVVAVGNPLFSHVKICRDFRLMHPSLLKSVLSKNVYAVEKSTVQVAGFFGLDRNPHAVLGKRATDAFCASFGGKLELLPNSHNHQYLSSSPYRPIVCNRSDVVGVDCPSLLNLLESHLPLCFLGRPLLEQLDHVLHTGLLRHADEFISLALPDKRDVLGFHAGPSPKEGAQWSRQNGNGVAIAGLGKNSLKASDSFRHWILCLNVLVSHTFLERFLSNTTRKAQGIPCSVRQEARRNWLDYQGISPDNANKLVPRLSDAVSLTTGQTVFHFDGLNDSKSEHDNISLGMKYIKNWSEYCSKRSLQKLESHGLRVANTAFTALAYQRAINGSVTDRIKGVADVSCPLFQEVVKLIRDSKYPFDPNLIEDPSLRSLFRSSILALPKQTEIKYCGRYLLAHEGNNRFTFLGTIVFGWLSVVDKFVSIVCHVHSEVVVAFCMREINGAPLICAVLKRLLLPANKARTETALLHTDDSEFYILLCTLMFEVTGAKLGRVNCSKRNRWQNVDKSLWDGTDCGRAKILCYLGFVQEQFATLRGSAPACDHQHARDMLTSNSHRAKHCTEDEQSVAKLGAVRGTFGIQLSAWMLVTPSHNAGVATIEKGGSGFYKFVNSFKRREYSGRDLSTEEAREEEERLLDGLREYGLKLDHAFLDQAGCYWWRLFGTKGKDKRKMDVFFVDDDSQLLYAPMRYRVYSYKAIAAGGTDRYDIEFFVFDKWYRLRDYLCPGFDVPGDRHVGIRRQPSWEHGSLQCFREKACHLEDGTSSFF